MKLKNRKIGLWHKYILYYCIIFIVPFIVLASFIFKNSLSNVEKEFENNILSNLNQSKKILLSQIEELDNIAMQISKDAHISPYKMDHPYYSNIGNELISRYIASKPFVEDVILNYFSNSEKYYSSNGSYNDINILINEEYTNLDISQKEFKQIFNITTPQIVSFPIKDELETKFELYYTFPLYDSNGRQNGTATFLFDEVKLGNMIPTLDKNKIYITNRNNDVILTNNINLEKELIDKSGKISNEIFNNNTYDIENYKFRIIKSYYDKLGINFVNVSDSNDLVTSLINTKISILKLLIILFLMGLILILGISYFQYIPIRRINTTLKEKRRGYFNKNIRNELINIEMLISEIIDENEELLVRNEALYKVDKNQLLLNLIEGTDQDKESMEKSQFILDLETKFKKYYIILIKKYQLSKESKAHMHKSLPIENKKYNIFSIQIPLQDKIGLLVAHKDSDITMLESLKDIESKLSIIENDLYLYCGKIYNDLYKINHSYIEAMVACDYIINDTENKSILYKELDYSKDYVLRYPYDIEEKLSHGLKQGTQEVVNDSLEQIFDFINLNKYYSKEIKIYTFYLINFVIRIASTLDFPQHEINIKDLSDYNKLEKFEENLRNVVNNINQFVLSKKTKVRDKFKDGIFTDILENYKSHDLSLEFLSQKYDYSVPYLSKLIKEETGMTFTKYIQELRFKYIKEKLIETELSIKEIIFQAGYYDISNFSRKFKNIMGVTPGQYRELNKKSQNLEMAYNKE